MVITTDLNGGVLASSDAVRYCPSLPSWLKVAELGTNSTVKPFKTSSAAYECVRQLDPMTSVTTALGLSIAPLLTSEPESKQTSMQQSSSSGSTSSEQHNYEKFKMLFRGLSRRIPQQEEAISLICKTLVSSRMAGESPRSACPIRGIWCALTGPQIHFKKTIVAAIAELLWGEHGNIVYVDLNSSVEKGVRGQTDVDSIAEALNKKPFSVVFLEDVEKADMLLRRTLSMAVRTGKFTDSHGRDVSTSNAIFLVASAIISKNKQPIQSESVTFTETRILKAKGKAFRMFHRQNSHPAEGLVAEQTSSVFKRKLADADVSAHDKRVFKQASDSGFDLNLPAVDDNDVDQMIERHFDEEQHSQISPNIWLKDFMEQMDETVEFKPFDFDTLASKISKQMTDSLQDITGHEHFLEIDTDVLEQILAVAYTSDNTAIVDDWIRSVVTNHFKEAKTRYDFSSPSVVKLSTCNLVYSTVDLAPFLPPSIGLS